MLQLKIELTHFKVQITKSIVKLSDISNILRRPLVFQFQMV